MRALLLNEQPLLVLRSLAVKIGLNQAIVLQQLHFLLSVENNGRVLKDGYRWVYNTMTQWREQFFPFWSDEALQLAFSKLETAGLIKTCQPEGRVSRTKYYRTVPERLDELVDDIACESRQSRESEYRQQRESEYRQTRSSLLTEKTAKKTTEMAKSDFRITETDPELDEEPRPTKSQIVMTNARKVLEYLNQQTGRSFRETDSNLRIIAARLKEPGIDLEEVGAMIDRQVARWKGTKMEEYLRPATLFNATKFESYYEARNNPVEYAEKKQTQPSRVVL